MKNAKWRANKMTIIDKCIGEKQSKDIALSCVISAVEGECEIIMGEGEAELRVLSSKYKIDTKEKKVCDSEGNLFDFDVSGGNEYFSVRSVVDSAIRGDFVLDNDFDKRIIKRIERGVYQGLSILMGKARGELKQTMLDWCKKGL